MLDSTTQEMQRIRELEGNLSFFLTSALAKGSLVDGWEQERGKGKLRALSGCCRKAGVLHPSCREPFRPEQMHGGAGGNEELGS